MISRFGNKGFLAAHYEWLVLGVGILALAGGAAFYVMSRGNDPEEAAAASVAEVNRMQPSENGVKPLDMSAMEGAIRITKSPLTMADVPEKTESFLASERRVLCKCKKVISGDVKAFPKCPYCGEKQEEEQVVVVDADKDGMPDEWEKKFGLNLNDPSDANGDLDKDEFTNLEEYQAKTDPTNRNDHPDYLDSLKIVLPLKQMYMPFIFTKASQIPGGWRCEFFDAKRFDPKRGSTGVLSATIGKEIADTGYIVKSYEAKTTKRERKGMKGMMVTVDVSEVTLERKSDSKKVTLVLAANRKEKPVPVDVQATLCYERGTAKNIEAVPGSEITLSGTKYRVVDIKSVGKSVKVTIAHSLTGKKRTLEALEQ